MFVRTFVTLWNIIYTFAASIDIKWFSTVWIQIGIFIKYFYSDFIGIQKLIKVFYITKTEPNYWTLHQ